MTVDEAKVEKKSDAICFRHFRCCSPLGRERLSHSERKPTYEDNRDDCEEHDGPPLLHRLFCKFCGFFCRFSGFFNLFSSGPSFRKACLLLP